MAYVILVLGLVLIALTFKRTWGFQVLDLDYHAEKNEIPENETEKEPDESNQTGKIEDGKVFDNDTGEKDRLGDIENKLEVIAEILTELKEGLERIEKGQTAMEKEPGRFNKILAHEKKNVLFEDIYAAYDAGKDVTELAREFGRGKGEIELILDLRR